MLEKRSQLASVIGDLFQESVFRVIKQNRSIEAVNIKELQAFTNEVFTRAWNK